MFYFCIIFTSKLYKHFYNRIISIRQLTQVPYNLKNADKSYKHLAVGNFFKTL